MRNAHTVADVRAAEQALMARAAGRGADAARCRRARAVCARPARPGLRCAGRRAGRQRRQRRRRAVRGRPAGRRGARHRGRGGADCTRPAAAALRGGQVGRWRRGRAAARARPAAPSRVDLAGAREIRGAEARPRSRAADLIIDGLTGIGGQGGLREPAATLARLTERARRDGALVVAVDLPSGIDADTGEVHGAAIRADVTVTFGTSSRACSSTPARTTPARPS